MYLVNIVIILSRHDLNKKRLCVMGGEDKEGGKVG
jgi:hypothetical protein